MFHIMYLCSFYKKLELQEFKLKGGSHLRLYRYDLVMTELFTSTHKVCVWNLFLFE